MKSWLKAFLKDTRWISIIYISNAILLNIYYWITSGKNTEIVYPMIMSLFLYLILMAVLGHRYFSLAQKILRGKVEPSGYRFNHMEEAVISGVEHIKRRHSAQMREKEEEFQRQSYFVCSCVHNIKAPLTVLKMASGEGSYANREMIMDEVCRIDTECRKVLEIIRMGRFAEDFLPGKISLRESIEKVIKRNKHIFIKKSIIPKIHIEEGADVIYSDRKWNELIIEQVTSNALKYASPHRRGEITYRAELCKDGVILNIEDNGIGIKKSELNRVTEFSFTGTNGRNHEDSSGVGLYICSLLCEKMNQGFGINSEEGEGTNISITYRMEEKAWEY